MKNENLLKKYSFLVFEQNKVMNITGFKNTEEIWLEGIINSIDAFNPYMEIFPNNLKLLDIGAGAGFPSLPFLIENNYCELTIIESQTKRCNFLKNVKNDLNLNFTIINDRTENVKDYIFDVITARAVSSIKNIFLMSHHLLRDKGYFYLIKGENYQKELDEFINIFPEYKEKILIKKYSKKSYVIVFQKIFKTPKNWPLSWNNIKKYN
ncbi:rRNA small subunit 7-methylguanosine (m7G)methyltransferase GidB [Mycoplasmopsis meleagridis]|uniref:Ribosomal RNA small subunit methyltransferase G n=1 Tax=Mycoplasmopsis meleagridis ATCC 25294 TaxID=1264554 RepID=A0A0F5H0K6_9BACT|nr:16S rRNA (guanine(527)-N(7))-methyltransferase RsmG [Mycoplasmopsis meleagridis]KKB26660.1 rRNA small subunit 7-methylguanosine (m7G)methyltransferase GidB [Mycoplasmopsis meleagridis ATCC 25294]OAD18225.1 rRNA small subunit 7-methylguanosine (m7G)methyltransferase GidB [Mycoplasmopsis meleagridis]VEU77714.1 glucose-inhibited division protein B [Mycoplasmopsis meleagridis]